MPVLVRRTYERIRCVLGIHRLSAWRARESFEQVHAIPMNPRSTPGPGDIRRCDYCGARWRGAYDGIEPSWTRLDPIRTDRLDAR